MTAPRPLLSEEERQVPRALVERALVLVGRVHRGRPEAAAAAQAELQQWRSGSPERAEAAATAQRIWNATQAEGLREHLPLPPAGGPARRRFVGLLGVAALLGGAGAGGRWYWRRPVYAAQLRTGHAQTLAKALPDGSLLDLAANTALEVAYHRDRRTIRLLAGQTRFEVAADAQRPFGVETAWGRARALGTVFSVSLRGDRMDVAVARGRVAVWPAAGAGGAAGAGEPPAILQAGEAIDVGALGMGGRVSVDVGEVADWKQGWLVFRNTPLPEAVARWNDYLGQPMRLSDAAVLRDLRVTGSYPLRQPGAFLDSLPRMLPVRVARAADGAADISPR